MCYKIIHPCLIMLVRFIYVVWFVKDFKSPQSANQTLSTLRKKNLLQSKSTWTEGPLINTAPEEN